MSDYRKISPLFWTGRMGKSLRGHPEAQIVATYLITAPSANALGLYYLPVVFIAHDTGLPFEGASEGLRRCIEGGFCAYDEDSEVVWVFEMAAWQVASKLSEKDNRVSWVNKQYKNLPDNPFLFDFFERYGEAFLLDKRRGSEGDSKGLGRAFEAKSRSKSTSKSTSNEADASCPEPQAASEPEVPVFVSLSLIQRDGKYDVTEPQVKAWEDDFPGIDVRQEIRKARAWCEANPSKRKTTKGILRFLVNWLSRAQDNAGGRPQAGASAPGMSPTTAQNVENLRGFAAGGTQ